MCSIRQTCLEPLSTYFSSPLLPDQLISSVQCVRFLHTAESMYGNRLCNVVHSGVSQLEAILTSDSFVLSIISYCTDELDSSRPGGSNKLST